MRPVHMLLLFLVIFAWGGNFWAAKVITDALPPVYANFLRFAVLVVFLAPFLRWHRGSMGTLFAVGIILGVFHFGAFFAGLALADSLAGVAIAVQCNAPFAALLAVAFLGERMTGPRVAGMVMAFVGVIGLGFDEQAFAYPMALLLILISGLAYGVGSLVMRKIRGVGVLSFQAWIGLFGLPGSALLTLLIEQNHVATTGQIGSSEIASLLYMSLAATVVGHGGMFYLLQRYPVTLVLPVTLLTPLIGVATGLLVYQESLSLKIVVGGTLTLVGVAILSFTAVGDDNPQDAPGPGSDPEMLVEPR